MFKQLFSVLMIGLVAHVGAHPVGEQQNIKPSVVGEATYLANEGVMIQAGDNKIVFDPFFHNDFGYYQLVPENIRTAMFNGTPPYDNIDAVFISHAHEDHFSAVDMERFLVAHPKVRLFAPQQAAAQLMKMNVSKSVMERVSSIDVKYGAKPWVAKLDGVFVEAVRIPHAGGQGRKYIQNMVFRVSLKGNVTVIHMGDAEPNDQYFSHYEQFWKARQTDVSFPPYWFFSSNDGNKILYERINAQHHIGVHIPIKVPEPLAKSGLDIFTIPGETRRIKR